MPSPGVELRELTPRSWTELLRVCSNALFDKMRIARDAGLDLRREGAQKVHKCST